MESWPLSYEQPPPWHAFPNCDVAMYRTACLVLSSDSRAMTTNKNERLSSKLLTWIRALRTRGFKIFPYGPISVADSHSSGCHVIAWVRSLWGVLYSQSSTGSGYTWQVISNWNGHLPSFGSSLPCSRMDSREFTGLRIWDGRRQA